MKLHIVYMYMCTRLVFISRVMSSSSSSDLPPLVRRLR